MTRLCYAMDVPRGARVVDDGFVIADVELILDERRLPKLVALTDTAGRSHLFKTSDRIEIDEDTPERRDRLHFASRLLSGDLFGVDR